LLVSVVCRLIAAAGCWLHLLNVQASRRGKGEGGCRLPAVICCWLLLMAVPAGWLLLLQGVVVLLNTLPRAAAVVGFALPSL
jgi:hypothetical protein